MFSLNFKLRTALRNSCIVILCDVKYDGDCISGLTFVWGNLIWSCIPWFIGTLPDRLRDYTVWSTLEPSGMDSHTWAGIIQVGSATPKTIISDRGAQFITRFWEQLQYALGTKLIRSSAYHPQTDEQTERVNQILEDMLQVCIIHYGASWDKCLALAEFSYNNSYQSSLQMAPFEALYDRRCWTPLSWSETGERKIFGPDLVIEAEDKVKVIQANLKIA
jgi:hypothetical protein